MIGYLCKYAPVEIFEAFGEECVPICPECGKGSVCPEVHPNMCSFIRAVFSSVKDGSYDGIVLTSCCDSTKRLYDILASEFPDKFIYMLDLPRRKDRSAVMAYKNRIADMISSYRKYSGSSFNEEAIRSCRACSHDPLPSFSESRLNVVLMGARMNPQIRDILLRHDVNIAADMSCTGIARSIKADGDDLLLSYAESLLSQYPCMRMAECGRRFQSELMRADGIIYHSVQFCDMYSFEYSMLSSHSNIPLLLINTDYGALPGGQLQTRAEAFIEEISGGERMEAVSEGRYVIGIDSGSTSTNGILMDLDGNIISSAVLPTGARASESSEKVYSMLLSAKGISPGDIAVSVATGYGRSSLSFASSAVTEISCHAKGAHFIDPSVRTLLDIGGQDSKAIRIGGNGEVLDFAMNDKCAAGTGRFLESIARTLGLPVEKLGEYALRADHETEITSMCTVFAESEVISLIAENKDIEDIAAGVCASVSSRAAALMKRVGIEESVMMSGGVANNSGVVKAVEKRIGHHVIIPSEPELVGAIGAAVFALERSGRSCSKEQDYAHTSG